MTRLQQNNTDQCSMGCCSFLCFFNPSRLCFLANRMFRKNLGSTWKEEAYNIRHINLWSFLHTLTPFSEGYRYRFGFLIPFLWFLKAVQEKQSTLQILDTRLNDRSNILWAPLHPLSTKADIDVSTNSWLNLSTPFLYNFKWLSTNQIYRSKSHKQGLALDKPDWINPQFNNVAEQPT